MKSKSTYLSRCLALLLVICITDQLSSVTGHSMKSAAARGRKIDENKLEEMMNKVLNERSEQQRAITKRHILSARLDQTINLQPDNKIRGLAIRGNKLYVGYTGVDQATIDIYNVSGFSVERRLTIAGVACIFGMASCPDCDVVFIADGCSSKIYVFDDVGLRTQWNVGIDPYGLSVNSQSNVIVTFPYTRQLREYTPTGELVREITLQSDMEYPWHAIQLDNDRYVVAHGYDNSLQRVCIINGNGTVVQCYGGLVGSGVGQLYTPTQLALFGESLLVADHGNFRVLQFDVSSLTYIGELINARSEERRPYALALNADGSRLFVHSFTSVVDTQPIYVYSLITE